MQPLYILDETNVHFTPKTCAEAVILFNRIRNKGNARFWDITHRVLQQCAAGLDETEYNKFYQWVINPYDTAMPPQVPDDYFRALDTSVVGQSSQTIHQDDEKIAS